MKAHLIGFELSVGKGITMAEFFEHLTSLKGNPIKLDAYERLVYVSEKDNYYIVLFLTIKNQTKFIELRDSEEGFKINVRALEDGTNLIDFNFMILNKETYRGLYQHYHNSCTLRQFGMFCRNQYEALKGDKEKAEYVRIEAQHVPLGGIDSSKIKAQAKKAYKGTLSLVPMVRQEKFEELINTLERVSVFEFDLLRLTSNEPAFAPIRPFVKRETHKIRFASSASQTTIRSWVMETIGIKAIAKCKISGLGEDGHRQAFRLMDIPDSFGEYEYEDLVDGSKLNLDHFADSPVVGDMLRAAKEHGALFDAVVK